jgi:hypothetical protein
LWLFIPLYIEKRLLMQNSTIKRIAIFTIALLFSLLCEFSAYAKTPQTYDQLWKRVDSLLQVRQPESTLKILEAIYQKSKREGSQVQQVKSFVGIQQVKFETSDEVVPYPFKVWEDELSGLSSGNKSVLLAYQGEFMVQLFNRNRGEIFNRTKGSARPDDIITWDVPYFKSKIDSCFLKSLENYDLLAKISSRDYIALLDTVALAWRYRPTLLDLVAAKALDFYRNDGFDLSPVPFPWVKDATMFSDAFYPKTTNSGRFDSRIFEIFRVLEAHHKKNDEADALLHLKLERLDYIYQSSLLASKDESYLEALKTLQIQVGNHPFKAEVMEKQADIFSSMAYRYNPSDHMSEIFRMKKSEAARTYASVIEQYPESPAKARCANKLRQLTAPSLHLTLENIIRKGFPFAVLTDYANLSALKAKLSRVNQSEYLKFLKSGINFPQNENQKFRSSTIISETSFQLAKDMDLRGHSTELIFPKLNSGLYLIELEGITGTDTCTSRALFTVSGISFSEQSGTFNVMNIENGEPVKGADIELFEQKNNYWGSSRSKTSAEGTLKTHAVSHLVQISMGADTLLTRWYINRTIGQVNTPSNQLYLFTDRSIYRPGQTLFFKGIFFVKDSDKIKSIENQSVEVVLQNGNYQNIDTLTLTTNSYGTITGKFRIPSGGLPGGFRLISPNGSIPFRVEEYRRPGFKIEFDDLKGEYRINSKVEVTGNVASFSGVPLKNVTGKYRVSRSLTWAWRSWGEPEQIDEGTFATDPDGKYRLTFIANPGEQYAETSTYPFLFEVEIEITDITGETQRATRSLNISKESLTASVKGPDIFDLAKIPGKEELKFSFKVINSDNQEIKAKKKVELIRLKSPQLPLRKRLWANPDRPVYSENQWNKLFPGNQFGEEIQPVNYEEDKIIQQFDPDEDQREAGFNTLKLEQGYYKVRLITTDQFGTPVKAEHLVRVFDSSKKIFLFPENSWVNLSGTAAVPGESVELLLGNFGKQFWKVQVHRKDRIVTLFNGLVDKSMIKINIPVLAGDQGGFNISLSSMSQGRSFYNEYNVTVPWVQKTLKVSVEDFPKVVVPGKEVTWKIKVVDSEGNPVKTEIAGVVYDASLDKILPHNWQLMIWENSAYFRSLRFPGEIASGIGQCTPSNWIMEKQEVLPELRKVIDYQAYLNQRNGYSIRGSRVKSGTVPAPEMVSDVMMKQQTVSAVKVDYSDRETTRSEEDKPIEMRSDFREMAWFDALLETSNNGSGEVRFKLPESVAEWKFMALAHTPEGLSGTITEKFVTRKKLMVEPFPTRFLNVGDEATLPVKVTNLSGKSLSLDVMMELVNLETGKNIETASRLVKIVLADGISEAVNWDLLAPAKPGLYQIRVTARGDGYSDGFESVLPVEPDRTWTTESKAFTIKPGNNYSINFNQLGGNEQVNEGKWNLTLMTNPIGLILDALPQLIGSESTTISGTASRLSGALILRKILADHPEIAKELELQRNKLLNHPDSFKTRLEKGEQFTNLKLKETPWLQESIYEKDKLAKFNPDTMKTVIKEDIERIEAAQLPDGGFAWCPGMESSEWMTAQVLNELAQMRSKHLLSGSENPRMMAISLKGVNYLDHQITETFRRLKEKDKINYQPASYIFDYLYARSALKDFEFAPGTKEAYTFYLEKASQNWTKTGIWQQVQLAFVLKRDTNQKLLQTIIQSLQERAIKNSETGMYWKPVRGLYFYRESDIALQGMIIELFCTINAPVENINAMRLWLLQQKRTHAWDSPYATSRAVYAMMSGQHEPIGNHPLPELFLDGKKIVPEGSKSIDGFIQLTIGQNDVSRNSKLEFRNTGKNIIFGGLFHGYFKMVNDTSRFGSSLKIRKEIFKLEKSVRGDSLVSNTSGCRPGDLLMVRLLIENDRDLGFISLDDQRPAGTEPLNQLSAYEYNSGLWYYRVNVDTGTRFFIGNLPKGRFVLEYPVRVSHLGTFSGGRANIQCSFAPEFGANHSPGKLIFKAN